MTEINYDASKFAEWRAKDITQGLNQNEKDEFNTQLEQEIQRAIRTTEASNTEFRTLHRQLKKVEARLEAGRSLTDDDIQNLQQIRAELFNQHGQLLDNATDLEDDYADVAEVNDVDGEGDRPDAAAGETHEGQRRAAREQLFAAQQQRFAHENLLSRVDIALSHAAPEAAPHNEETSIESSVPTASENPQSETLEHPENRNQDAPEQDLTNFEILANEKESLQANLDVFFHSYEAGFDVNNFNEGATSGFDFLNSIQQFLNMCEEVKNSITGDRSLSQKTKILNFETQANQSREQIVTLLNQLIDAFPDVNLETSLRRVYALQSLLETRSIDPDLKTSLQNKLDEQLNSLFSVSEFGYNLEPLLNEDAESILNFGANSDERREAILEEISHFFDGINIDTNPENNTHIKEILINKIFKLCYEEQLDSVEQLIEGPNLTQFTEQTSQLKHLLEHDVDILLNSKETSSKGESTYGYSGEVLAKNLLITKISELKPTIKFYRQLLEKLDPENHNYHSINKALTAATELVEKAEESPAMKIKESQSKFERRLSDGSSVDGFLSSIYLSPESSNDTEGAMVMARARFLRDYFIPKEYSSRLEDIKHQIDDLPISDDEKAARKADEESRSQESMVKYQDYVMKLATLTGWGEYCVGNVDTDTMQAYAGKAGYKLSKIWEEKSGSFDAHESFFFNSQLFKFDKVFRTIDGETREVKGASFSTQNGRFEDMNGEAVGGEKELMILVKEYYAVLNDPYETDAANSGLMTRLFGSDSEIAKARGKYTPSNILTDTSNPGLQLIDVLISSHRQDIFKYDSDDVVAAKRRGLIFVLSELDATSNADLHQVGGNSSSLKPESKPSSTFGGGFIAAGGRALTKQFNPLYARLYSEIVDIRRAYSNDTLYRGGRKTHLAKLEERASVLKEYDYAKSWHHLHLVDQRLAREGRNGKFNPVHLLDGTLNFGSLAVSTDLSPSSLAGLQDMQNKLIDKALNPPEPNSVSKERVRDMVIEICNPLSAFKSLKEVAQTNREIAQFLQFSIACANSALKFILMSVPGYNEGFRNGISGKIRTSQYKRNYYDVRQIMISTIQDSLKHDSLFETALLNFIGDQREDDTFLKEYEPSQLSYNMSFRDYARKHPDAQDYVDFSLSGKYRDIKLLKQPKHGSKDPEAELEQK